MAGTTLTVLSGLTSGDGLTVTGSGSTGIAKSVDLRRLNQSNKYYFEVKFNTAGMHSNGAVGLCHSGSAFSSTGADMVLCYPNFSSGLVYLMGSSTGVAAGGSYAANDVICVAVDLSNQRVWFRRNGGNWNNSGTADPTTNVGGISIASMLGFVAPVVQLSASGNTATANFGDTAFAQSVPSGFTSGWPTPGDPTALVNSFEAVEVFHTGPDSSLHVTFAAIEVWRSTADAPAAPAGAGALLMGL
jgi:hypothetical protein